MKVSVIIPAYNAEKHMDKCMESLLNQTFSDYELIIVNDGSTDKTEVMLAEYSKLYGNIKVINQENQGQGAARNNAIKIAKGEYIIFVDIDDYIALDAIEKLYNVAVEKKSDLVFCDYYEVREKGELTCVSNDRFGLENEHAKAILASFGPTAKLYDKDFFVNSGLEFMEGKIFEDIAIVPVLGALAKNPVHVPDALYYYNVSNVSSIRAKKYKKKLEDVFYSMNVTIDNFKKFSLHEKYKDEIDYIFMSSFYKSSILRFIDFKEGKDAVLKTRKILFNDHPNYRKNKYYKMESIKMKVIYELSFWLPVTILYYIKKINNIILRK